MLRECVLSLLLAQATAFSSSTPLSTTQTAEILQFPVGDANLGTVSVTASDAELTLHANLGNLPANESGGIHIHYGFACDNEMTVKGDAPAGANKGHYYVPADPAAAPVTSEDPWAFVFWQKHDLGKVFFSDGQANAMGAMVFNTILPEASEMVGGSPAGSTEAEELTVVLSAADLNVNPMTALDRVVIVHAPNGTKIGCGVLA